MRRSSAFLIASLLLAVWAAAPASAARTGHMTLQYASKPGAGKQAKLRLTKRLGKLGGLQVRSFRKLPMLVVTGSPAKLARAAKLPGVKAAHRMGEKVGFDLDKSVPLVFNGEANRDAEWTAGHDGTGQVIAIVDSGVDSTHVDLLNRVTRNVKFLYDSRSAFIGVGTTQAPTIVAQECPGPCNTDSFGHGTHVAGTAAGDGTVPVDGVKGVAPGAHIVGLGISSSGATLDWYPLAAFDYILDNPELSVDVVNNSWHVPMDKFDPTHPINVATKMLHTHGITVVFAAGNFSSGPGGKGRPTGSSLCEGDRAACKINKLSVAPWVMSVAAGARVWDGGFPAQRLADFSSRGDAIPQHIAGFGEIKYWPSITAPGTGILGTSSPTTVMNPATCWVIGDIPRCTERTPSQTVFYTAPNGTSMASPHVAGAVAVLQSAAAKRGMRLDPDQVKATLMDSAAPMTAIDGSYDFCEWSVPPFDESPCPGDGAGFTGQPYAEWQVGAGYLNVDAALDAVAALPAP